MTTAAEIQAILDNGGSALVPAGETVMVDAVAGQIRPRNGSTLQIDGTLQALPSRQGSYQVIRVEAVDSAKIILNGQVRGERDQHINDSSDPQYAVGFGIGLYGATNLSIRGAGSVSNCWGDGIYVDHGSKGITLDGITSNGNQRQGMSLIDVDGLTATNCKFINNNPSPPSAGIDMEPDDPTRQSIRNVAIKNCDFRGNAGAGILIACPPSARSGITITGCTYDGHPIDGTDGIVPWYAKMLHQVFKKYWFYPKSLSL